MQDFKGRNVKVHSLKLEVGMAPIGHHTNHHTNVTIVALLGVMLSVCIAM